VKFRIGNAPPPLTRRALSAGLAVAVMTPGAARAQARSGIAVDAMDRTVRPGDDFDAFASGGWRARTPIPPDRQDIGTIQALTDQTEVKLRRIFEEAAAAPRTPEDRLMGDLYAAYLDEQRVEAAGASGLSRDLAAVAGLADRTSLARFMGGSQSGFGRGVFVCDVWVDLKNPRRPALRLRQDGLLLDYREAYADPQTVQALEGYMTTALGLAGWPEPAAAASRLIALERKVAETCWTVAQNRDRLKRYNPMSIPELAAYAPGFDWTAYFDGLGVGALPVIFVQQKTAMPGIAAAFAETPLETLKAWSAFQLIDQAAPCLPRRFESARFDFRGRVLQGVTEPEPRWRQAVRLIDDGLRDAVGQAFVRRHFDPRSKALVERMAGRFKTAMAARIRGLAWMSPATKASALEKLAKVRVMVGYPRRWESYRGLTIDRRDLYGSVRRLRAFNWRAETDKLRRTPDPEYWFLPPQRVDGFSDQSRVAFGVPAAILQPPIFDPAADAAANYGALGQLIGHELTHQFDDQGRKYGADGAIHDWWTAGDAARFEETAAGLAAQFDAIEALPGVRLNGRQTLSENIADLGGLLLALDAYKLSLNGRPAPVIDGLTGEQRLFLAWARVFRSKDREESLRNQARAGDHTPFRFRAIGPMRNIDAWYAAFDVRPTDRYYVPPEARVRIW
jgi:putative endopeptidase